jgi:hypothetical protein
LYEAYDEARRTAKEADAAKVDAGNEIKVLLGDIQEAHTQNYSVTYAFDKDRIDEVFDEDQFQEKDPKKYAEYQQYLEDIKQITKKYTKTVTTKGARKLVVTASAE